MKLTRLVSAVVWLSVSMPAMVTAQDATEQPTPLQALEETLQQITEEPRAEVGVCDPGDDQFQRRLIFYNDSPVRVWPVIESPITDNCKDSRPGQVDGFSQDNWRLHVNATTKGAGIGPGEQVTVALPKCWPCGGGGFYKAVRLYVLLASAELLENKLVGRGDLTQKTNPYSAGLAKRICGTGPAPDPCWTGSSHAGYALDSPFQLVEYTIISQKAGDPLPNANDPSGISVIDFDVSYVDNAYLPISMSIDDGSTQFMGSSAQYVDFKTRLKNFSEQAPWVSWGAYSTLNFNNQAGSTAFFDILTATDPNPPRSIPSAAQALQSINDRSIYFDAKADPGYPTICNDRLDHGGQGKYNLQCSELLPNEGQCCPGVNGIQSCCDQSNFIVDKVHREYRPKSDNPVDKGNGTFRLFSDVQTDLTRRFTKWKFNSPPSCSTAPPSTGGVVASELEVEFCTMFKRTVHYVWQAFIDQDNGRTTPICKASETRDSNAYQECVLRLIIGYAIDETAKKKFDGQCKECIKDPQAGLCPTVCADEQLLNESVQALMRGVPWTSVAGQAACKTCPNVPPDANQCSRAQLAACVWADPNLKFTTDSRVYQFDKFLHFWPPPSSVYNLNPYARVIHCGPEADAKCQDVNGLDSPGTYSFSIDDFYGNFGAPGSGVIINIGDTKRLKNPEPNDPYNQYFVALAAGWHHLWLCRDANNPGRRVDVNVDANTGKGGPFNTRFSFYQPDRTQPDGPGKRVDPCVVEIYAGENETRNFVKFKLTERTYDVRDTLTGRTHRVKTLAGPIADRGQSDFDNDFFCSQSGNHDPQAMLDQKICLTKLAAVGRGNRDAYSNVVEDCPNNAINECGRPQTSLIIVSPPKGL
jgi:hypothetical protein